jgi:hypothetical protein
MFPDAGSRFEDTERFVFTPSNAKSTGERAHRGANILFDREIVRKVRLSATHRARAAFGGRFGNVERIGRVFDGEAPTK